MNLFQKFISSYILIILVVLFCGSSANAQNLKGDNSIVFQSHMKFMGVPIDGSIDTFVSSLESKGIKRLNGSDYHTNLKGRFFSYDGIYMTVYCEPRLSQTVYKVVVNLYLSKETCDDLWNRIIDKYEDIEGVYFAKDPNLGSFFCVFPAKKGVEVVWSNKQTFGNYISLEKIKDNNWGNYILTYWDKENYIKHINAEDDDL